jgi:hypothetical protein
LELPHKGKKQEKRVFILAGLLTYSIFECPSRFFTKQWKKVLSKDFWRSLQQRVCSGFSPDSLFSVLSEWKDATKISGVKIMLFRDLILVVDKISALNDRTSSDYLCLERLKLHKSKLF